MLYSFKKLSLRQLDRSLQTLPPVKPRKGWLARVRKTLGLSQATLAGRMGISQQALDRMEKREIDGKIALETLAEAAKAMDARLVYFLIPAHDASFEDLLKRRARAAAKRFFDSVDRTMTLEDQRTSAQAREDEIAEIAEELFRTFAVEIWEKCV